MVVVFFGKRNSGKTTLCRNFYQWVRSNTPLRVHYIDNDKFRFIFNLKSIDKETEIDLLEKASNNNMTQFYIKVIGITAVVIVVLTITSNIYPTLFTAKALLPSYVYNLVQTYTPFLQTKKVFTLKDPTCGIDWIVHVYNDKHFEINVTEYSRFLIDVLKL